MGLDTSHNCWHGPYSAFARWRAKICEVAGYGNIMEYEGYGDGNTKQFPSADPLSILLNHSDCDGEIKAKDCLPLADRLKQLMPTLTAAGDLFPSYGYAEATKRFIDGLRLAASENEPVIFS